MRFNPVLVTAPDSGDPIVTLDEAKAHLRVTHSTDDDYIAALVAAAVDLLDGWRGALGRCLVTQTWRILLDDWPACDRIDLPFPDCSSVVVKYSDESDVEQTVSASLYQILEHGRATSIYFRDAFTSPSLYDDREDPVRIEFAAGYGDAADVPAAIKHAIKLAIGHLYENREQVIVGQVDVAELPMGFRRLISPFRASAMVI